MKTSRSMGLSETSAALPTGLFSMSIAGLSVPRRMQASQRLAVRLISPYLPNPDARMAHRRVATGQILDGSTQSRKSKDPLTSMPPMTSVLERTVSASTSTSVTSASALREYSAVSPTQSPRDWAIR